MKRQAFFWPILLAFVLSATAARSQTPAWQTSSHWTLFNTRGDKWYKIPADSLGKYNSRELSDDSMRIFLRVVTAISSDKPPLWMGAYVTTCILGNKKRKIDISYYGGFFFDETDKKYYSVPQDIQKDWLNYLAQSGGTIPYQKQ